MPPPTAPLLGTQFLTWRGVPLIPSDKVAVTEGRTNILLIRTGERKQGVVGLYQPNLPGEQSPGLSVRFMGINHKAIASYLVSLYCSLAVLTEDAIAVLEGVETGKYHEYRVKQRRSIARSWRSWRIGSSPRCRVQALRQAWPG